MVSSGTRACRRQPWAYYPTQQVTDLNHLGKLISSQLLSLSCKAFKAQFSEEKNWDEILDSFRGEGQEVDLYGSVAASLVVGGSPVHPT